MGNDVYRGPSMTDGQGADILPSLAAQIRPPSNRGSRYGAGRRLAEQGGRISREGTCNQRSATCSASPLAGAQLSQVRRGDRSPTVERSPLEHFPARLNQRAPTCHPRDGAPKSRSAAVFCRAHTVLAATNKCLAQSNKSRMGQSDQEAHNRDRQGVVILRLE